MAFSVLEIFHFVCIFARPVVFIAILFVALGYIGISEEIECDHLRKKGTD